jgi:high-affinity iron transporter
MTAAALITLRETLEASLVVGIVLTHLRVLSQQKQNHWVWSGVGSGVIMSIALAVVFHFAFGGFTGRAEQLYEGIIMLTAAGLITWMFLWMISAQREMRAHIEGQVQAHVESKHPFGLFLLVFLAVLREGVETVLFLQAAALQAQSAGEQLFGACLGIAIAIFASVLFFRGMSRVPVRMCFRVTSVLLLLFAAGLVAHGVHELQEAGVIPILVEHVWDTNALLNENGTVGSLMKGVFGYNGNPSLLEAAGYGLYLAVVVLLWRRRSAA